jgi:protein disulfide-isomerase A6
MNKLLFATCLTLINVASALYSDSSPVVKLTQQNFKELVLNDKNTMWLVEFYAPWCGHCKSLAPSWELAAKQLKGVVKVGAVDMTTDESVGRPYDVKGFPTLKFFGNDKNSPIAYEGGRDADSIRTWALSQTTKEVNARAKSKKESSSSSSSNSGNSGSNAGGSKASTDKDVVILTDSNFDATVNSSKDIWFVEFYAPWCGHCKNLEPEWNAAATALKGQVKFGKVDATAETELA